MIDIVYLSLAFIIFLFFLFIKSDRKITDFLLLLIEIIIVIPKINLFGSSSNMTTAGIRIDDFLVLLCLIISIFLIKKFRGNILKITWIMVIILLTCFISFFHGIITGLNTEFTYSLLSIIRKFEYFCLIFSGYAIAMKSDAKVNQIIYKHLVYIVIFLSFVGFLQFFNLANYYVSGSEADEFFGGLSVATFNGYYEYGCFMALMFFYFVKNKKTSINIIVCLLCITQVVLSESRVSLIALLIGIVILFASGIKKTRTKEQIEKFTASMFLYLIVFSIFIFLFSSNNLFDRFSEIRINALLDRFVYEYNNRDFFAYAYMVKNNIRVTTVIDTSGDLATNIRFFKWSAAIDGFYKYPIFGYGPGVTHVMDGNYIKILGEYGIIGLSLWVIIIYYAYKFTKDKCSYIKWFILVIGISAIMIDTFDASKIMEFFWFIIGINIFKKNDNILNNNEIHSIDMEVI